MLYLLLLYIPLALSITAVAHFIAQRLSRRGVGRFPRTTTSFQRDVAELLHATPVIDDAGAGWRLSQPADVRVSLPFALPDRASLQRDTGLADSLANEGSLTGADLDRYDAQHFAYLLRWPLPQVRKSPALPVAFGLPVELLSLLYTTEDGQHPPGTPYDPPPPFRVKSPSIERILREWPEFDGDLERLAKSSMQADFHRAYVLLRDEVVWLDQPIWPADQAPPAPFVINLIQDEAWVLCLCPGRPVSEAVAGPDWVALQMAWFAAALPALVAGAVRAQSIARDTVIARREKRKAAAQAGTQETQAAEAARSAAIAAAWLGPSEAIKPQEPAPPTPPASQPPASQPPAE
ncbi:MAG TPA: hypothetical protein VL860_15290 [Planctomycetota bacterium]|nr:hypothetical protein [Planctomycetota bacterium]